MKIRTLRNIAIAAAHVDANTVIDVDDHIARALVYMGKAVIEPATEAETDPGIETTAIEPATETAVQPKATKKRAK